MSEKKSNSIKVGSGATYGLGTIIAVSISWSANKAIGWAIIHGLLSWLYIIYYLFTKDGWTWF